MTGGTVTGGEPPPGGLGTGPGGRVVDVVDVVVELVVEDDVVVDEPGGALWLTADGPAG